MSIQRDLSAPGNVPHGQSLHLKFDNRIEIVGESSISNISLSNSLSFIIGINNLICCAVETMPAAFFTLNIFLRLTFLAWQTANGHRRFRLLDAELNVFQIEMKFCRARRDSRDYSLNDESLKNRKIELTAMIVFANFYPLVFSRFHWK
jgi:hypothetical protein